MRMKAMKRYLVVFMVILALTPVLPAGCAQEAELENRITSLETKLTAAESTNKVLQGRIEQLEKGPLTETDILSALRGKKIFARVGPLPGWTGWGNFRVSIVVE